MTQDSESKPQRKPHKLETAFSRIAAAAHRLERIEVLIGKKPGPPIRQDEGPPLSTICNLQTLLDDQNPRVAHVRDSLEAELESDLNHRVDMLNDRLDALDRYSRTTGVRQRRLGLRVLRGSKP